MADESLKIIVDEMREVVSSLTKAALMEGKNISPYKLSRIIDYWREELEKSIGR